MIGFDRAGRLALAVASCTAALTAASGALASAASASTVVPNKACYVTPEPAEGAPMTLTGAGFGAGDTIEVSGGLTFATTTATATGTFSVTTAAPTLKTDGPGAKATTLTITDQNATTGAQTTSTVVVHSANLAFATKPAAVHNLAADKVSYTFSGFVPGKHIYGYYALKKVVATMKFGRATGACGLLTQRALLFPGGHAQHRTYKVTFESTSRYDKNALPRVYGKLNIDIL
jgi:hypothetical protein